MPSDPFITGNMQHQIYFLFFSTLILFGCSTSKYQTSPELLFELATINADRPPLSIRNDGSPLFQHAEYFDRFVRGKLTTEQVVEIKKNCATSYKSGNPFCYSIQRAKRLFAFIEAKNKIRQPIEVKPLIPITPVFKNGEISNWKLLRESPVQELLKGLLFSTRAELLLLTEKALKETRFPGNIAVALAATLEDFLPEQVNPEDIATLYFQGGRCAKNSPSDQEHFYTRSALMFILKHNYRRAEQVLSKVQPVDAYSGRALYWLYRVRDKLGDQKGAALAFNKLLARHPFSFHAMAASKPLTKDFGESFLIERGIGKKRSLRVSKANQLISQIETLYNYGFGYSAAVLVNWALEEFPRLEPEVKLYLASQGDPTAKISATSSIFLKKSSLVTRQVMELAYPKVFFPLFLKYSSRNATPYIGLSVARKESSFNPNAISPAKAQGILQLNPDTVAKLTSNTSVNLLDPNINIELGMRYLELLLDKMQGQTYLALASYNAGELAVETWVRRFPGLDPLLFIDLIPYRETRDYVGFVLTNHFWYRRIYEGPLEIKEVIP